MRYELEIRGDKDAADRIEKLAKRASNVTPLLREAAGLMQKSINQAIGSSGRTAAPLRRGVPWADLAQATLDRKMRDGLPSTPLMATGKLRQSLSKGGRWHIFRTTQTMAIVGTKNPGARLHQFGTVFMPPRPMVALSRDSRRAVLRAVNDYFTVPA